MPQELPASALYSNPGLGRLWRQVHLNCSPFRHRPSVRRLYLRPASILRKILTTPYSLVALGCADGTKESLLFGKLPKPSYVLAADTNLSLARQASRHLPAHKKTFRKIDLSNSLPALHLPPFTKRVFTLYGVLPNLDPLPLLRRLARRMNRGDLLLFSANLAPGQKGRIGARRVLGQYDNLPTRRWLEAAVLRFRPRLPPGRLVFGVFRDPRQVALARVEARWITTQGSRIVLASRRPTKSQVEKWISRVGLRKLARFLEPRGEEGVWIVARRAARR
ncbi:MAG: hypothetical protein EB090_02605 [Verrucomicrobia bacterium]|nr:hypothetical protein [Verrucomicrobiota bacterium]